MTPRSALYVALVGLVMFLLCGVPLGLIAVLDPGLHPDVDDGLMRLYFGVITVLDLGSILGVIVLVVGLVVAGVLALTKQAGKPS
jgi:hypothetical protein